MARPINNNNLLKISQALTEANASQVRGLSVPELVEATGIDRFAIDRILKKPEFGFREAQNRTASGAVTWYHDLTEMMVYQKTDDDKIQPLMFDNEDRTRLLIHNLMSALMIADPANKLVAAVGKEMAEEAKPKGRGKSQQKDYFDWLVFPFKSDIIQWLTENKKAKDVTDMFFKSIEDGYPINEIIHAFVYQSLILIWNPETKNFRPEAIENKDSWELLLAIGLKTVMLSAYLREQEDETDKESSITSG